MSNYTGRSHIYANQNYDDDVSHNNHLNASTSKSTSNNGQSRLSYPNKTSNGHGFEDENEFYEGQNNRRNQSNFTEKRNSNQYGSKPERDYDKDGIYSQKYDNNAGAAYSNMNHRKECEEEEFSRAMQNYQNIRGNNEKPQSALPPKSFAKSPIVKTPSLNHPNSHNEFDGNYSNQKSTLDPYQNSGVRPLLSQTADYSRPKTISDHSSNNFPEKKQYSVQKYYKNNSHTNDDQTYGQQGRSGGDNNGQNDDFPERNSKNKETTDMKARGQVTRQRGHSAFEDQSEEQVPEQNTRMMKRFQKVEEGLQLCTEGCGRTFNEFALERHVKVCKKVFQDKRKVFDSTLTRGQQAQQSSEQVKLTNEEIRQEIMRKRNENHECPDCGRIFRFEVYEKHVKICLRVFTKKNRENSLIRKASQSNQGDSSLGQTSKLSGTSKLPPPAATASSSGTGANRQQKKPETNDSKKPPLKKSEDEARKNSVTNNQWDDVPVGGNSTKGNAWDDIPVGAKRSASSSAWDSASEYQQPSQTGSKMTAASTDWGDQDGLSPMTRKPPAHSKLQQPSQQRNQRKPSWNDDYSTQVQEEPPRPPAKPAAKAQPKQQQQQKAAWNDDWNDDVTSKPESQGTSPMKKNYNFNKQVKTLKSTNQSFDRNMDTNNDIYEDDDYADQGATNGNTFADKYVYSKPNIGKKVINSAKKQEPIQSPPKPNQKQIRASANYHDHDEDQVDQDRWGRQQQQQAKQPTKTQPKNKISDPSQNYQEEQVHATYSKPFLKKNSGNQSTNVRKPTPSSTAPTAERQSFEGGFNGAAPFEDPSDIPITKNTDFNRQMMELEMKVQQQQKQQDYSMQNNRFEQRRGGFGGDDQDGEQANLELIDCPEGCGRRFAEAALEKHSRICKKVFQQKRKAYNSAAHRVTEDQVKEQLVPTAALKPPQARKVQSTKPDESSYQNRQPQPQQNGFQQKQQQQQQMQNQQPARGLPPSAAKGGKPQTNPFEKKPENENTQVGKKMPSWKIQSLAFRAVMRSSKGESQPSEYDQKIIKEAFERDDYVQCDYCQRRFNTKAAERHIPFCKTKTEADKFKTGGKAAVANKLSGTSNLSKTANRRQY